MTPQSSFDPLSSQRLNQMIDIAISQPQLQAQRPVGWLTLLSAPRTALAMTAAIMLMVTTTFMFQKSTQVPQVVATISSDAIYNDVSDMMMIDVLDDLS
jgi:hypothetical protein